MKRLFILIILAILVIGCTNKQSDNSPVIPGKGNLGIKVDIAIRDFSFSPDSVTITKGTTVIWTNMDSATHTVVSDSGEEIKSDSISNGQSYSHTFSTAGTYDYHCGIHASMKGKVIVTDSNLPLGAQ
jgi:plastocyanin